MSGDFSRKTFVPAKNHSSVLMQQGRAQLDADWNEHVDIWHRRRRAETIDTIGRAIVPIETNTGFEISVDVSKIMIGRGRMYVDGLLAENHGPKEEPKEFDPVLEESRIDEAIGIDGQPFLYGSNAPTSGGPHLVYLDVWQREVTHLKDPKLIEPALGVDTTARMQTVWQVKVMQNIESTVTRNTPVEEIKDWKTDHPAADGRLSTMADPPTSTDDICLIPPKTGYRGLENRFYRVEIHAGGGEGKASFKWSRDNGSVGAGITEFVDSKTLKVSDTGKDEWSFSQRDWIEITDDEREFNGQSGVMARIKDVYPNTKTIILENALSAADFPVGQPDSMRHTRITRWDQKGKVLYKDGTQIIDLDSDASGVIPINKLDTGILLEEGIYVKFNLESDPNTGAVGQFRVGDYWTFAARTADGSLEELVKAAPQGIHHHFAKLALLTFPNSLEDWRDKWPPSFDGTGCCTYVLNPGDDIQGKINELPQEGGCICLKSGVHEIKAPLVIDRSFVHLHGEKPNTRLVRTNGATIISVAPGTGNVNYLERVQISDLSLETQAEKTANQEPQIIVDVSKIKGFSAVNCRFQCKSGSTAFTQGLCIQDSRHIRVEGCGFESLTMGIFCMHLDGRSEILANNLAYTDKNLDPDSAGIALFDVQAPCRIENNRVNGFARGIALEGSEEGSVIRNNLISRGEANTNMDPGFDRLFGIAVSAPGTHIAENVIQLVVRQHGGIQIYRRDNSVDANQIISLCRDAGKILPIGVMIGSAVKPSLDQPADGTLVKRNRFMGLQDAIRCPATNGLFPQHLAIENNVITRADDIAESVSAGISLETVKGSLVADNAVRVGGTAIEISFGMDNSVVGNRIEGSIKGIRAEGETSLRVTGCTISDIQLSGIHVTDFIDSLHLADCRVQCCGQNTQDEGLAGAGIGVLIQESDGHAEVVDCRISHTGLDSVGAFGMDGSGNYVLDRAVGLFIGNVESCLVQGNDIDAGISQDTKDEREHRAMILFGKPAAIVNESVGADGSARVLGNNASGPGRTALLDLSGIGYTDAESKDFYLFRSIIFSDNHCRHFARKSEDIDGSVLLNGLYFTVSGNHVRSEKPVSIRFLEMAAKFGRAAIVSNLTSGSIETPPARTVPLPLDRFNIINMGTP